jgi:hypothetical protein
LLVDAILSLGYVTIAGESESGQSNEMAAERTTRSGTLSSDAGPYYIPPCAVPEPVTVVRWWPHRRATGYIVNTWPKWPPFEGFHTLCNLHAEA